MPSRWWFLTGLLRITGATLLLERLDTRRPSVVTAFHVSLFAVSSAMFGMAVGAAHLDFDGPRARPEAALATEGTRLVVSIPLRHGANLALPMGVCSPLGQRRVRHMGEDAMPWLWGIRGATGDSLRSPP